VLRQLASFDIKERAEGVSRFKKLGKEQGTALVLYILGDKTLDNYRVEVMLARILADWKDPRAIGYLLESIKSPDDGAFSDNPRVLEAMGEQLQGPAARDRELAARTLLGFKTPQSVELLASRLKAETVKEVRAQIVVAIINSKHPRRREYLIDALTDPDLAIRELAWTVLKKYPELPRVAYDPDGPLEDRARDVATLRLWLHGEKKSSPP
jgi:hypothetical protein